MKKLFLFFVAIALIVPASSFAASDGEKGETSQGSAVITLKIPELIVAKGFNDITIEGTEELAPGTDPNNYITSDYSRFDTICVASNNQGAQNKYNVTVSNNNNTGSSDYFVESTNSDKVYFNLRYTDAQNTYEDLTQNVISTADFTAHTSLIDCDDASGRTDNATFTVTFSPSGGTTDRPSIDMVPAGVYVSTLTFLFTPNQESSDY